MMFDGKLLLNTANAENGNICATAFGTAGKKYKLQISQGTNKQIFDLRSDGIYELFPLPFGSGMYEVKLYENIYGKNYKEVSKLKFSVKLKRPDASQLVPNQFVNYGFDSSAVQTADILCSGHSPEETYRIICRYVKEHFRYDYVKAILVKAGALPDVEGTFEKKMGVCQDLAAVTVAMLRSQGIPAKLVIGYAGRQYHAWVTATVGGKEQLFDPTAEVSARRISKNYTVERWY